MCKIFSAVNFSIRKLLPRTSKPKGITLTKEVQL
jgi:hypothetical protein